MEGKGIWRNEKEGGNYVNKRLGYLWLYKDRNFSKSFI